MYYGTNNLQRLLRFLFKLNCLLNTYFRHWVSKHFQDFEQDAKLRAQTIKFLEEVTISPHLLPVEIRAASQLLRLLCREDMEHNQLKLQLLLTPPTVSRFMAKRFQN